jgi:hypothetical protein
VAYHQQRAVLFGLECLGVAAELTVYDEVPFTNGVALDRQTLAGHVLLEIVLVQTSNRLLDLAQVLAEPAAQRLRKAIMSKGRRVRGAWVHRARKGH